MRIGVAVVIAFAALLLPLHAAAVEAPWHTVETTTFEWRKGAPAYRFVVEAQQAEGDIIPHRLRIEGPGAHKEGVEPEGGIITIGEGLYGEDALARDNLIRSKFVFASPKFRAANGEPLVMVFGWSFASDPGPLMVFGLDAAGTPRIVFSHDTFALTSVADLDGDGTPELIGRRSFSQTFDDCHKTYDPFAVYRFTLPARGAMEYSLALSKAYNEAHYVGWAGENAREDVAVSLCGPNKGHIVKAPRGQSQ